MTNTLKDIRTKDVHFKVYDLKQSWSAGSIAREIESQYIIPEVTFKQDDIIVDIGAHVGIFSIYYAIKYPHIKIHCYEPTKRNYENLIRSLKHNSIKNVIAQNRAITADSREVILQQPLYNTGASSVFYNKGLNHTTQANKVESYSLGEVFEMVGGKIKILKIDTEGSEYEILKDNLHLLKNVEYLLGEFHHVPGTGFNAHQLHDDITNIMGVKRNLVNIIQTDTII